jgi:hypothetical protein
MLCLICWRDFWYDLAPFVCNEPDCKLPTVDVAAMIKKGVLPPEFGKRITTKKLEPIWKEYLRYEKKPPPSEIDLRFYPDWWKLHSREAECPGCRIATERRACPKCWSHLEVQDTKRAMIPTILVGWTGSGKTILIDAMAYQLEFNKTGDIGGYTGGPFRTYHLSTDDPNSPGAWRLFESGKVPGRTSGLITVGFFSAYPTRAETGLRSAIMPFRDYQGGYANLNIADQNELKFLIQRARHYLLLVDPQDEGRAVSVTGLVENLSMVAGSAIRQAYVSVVLVKADSLPSRFDSYVRAEVDRLLNLSAAKVGPLLDTSDQYLLDCAKLFRESTLLSSVGETGLIAALEEKVGRDRIAFFVTSATGCAVTKSGSQQQLTGPWDPRRVLDPLVWRMQVD